MTSMMFEYASQLEDALHRRGDPMTTSDFLAVLQEASGHSPEALTAGEREFLLDHTDLTNKDLSETGRSAAHIVAARDRAAAEAATESTSLTTTEVAELLGRFPANVRRSRAKCDLYAPAAPSSNAQLKFPRWQFIGHQPVPSLREIIPTFPTWSHPLTIESVMTTADESLDGLSPVQWLTQGGPPEAVVQLVTELDYE